MLCSVRNTDEANVTLGIHVNEVTMKKVIVMSVGALFIALSPAAVDACQRIGKVSHQHMVKSADLIVRPTAVKYEEAPNKTFWTTGEPESTVLFHVEEVLKGKDVPDKIILNGYLSDKDDFNELHVPYYFVRPGGRSGSCFANTYKQGAQFLLFLGKKKEGTAYTVEIDALAPVNEQLRSADDPWLVWVKGFLKTVERSRSQLIVALRPFGVSKAICTGDG
jgi:hypothetical protein